MTNLRKILGIILIIYFSTIGILYADGQFIGKNGSVFLMKIVDEMTDEIKYGVGIESENSDAAICMFNGIIAFDSDSIFYNRKHKVIEIKFRFDKEKVFSEYFLENDGMLQTVYSTDLIDKFKKHNYLLVEPDTTGSRKIYKFNLAGFAKLYDKMIELAND